ncbi:MAG TPA: hypothetical protein VFV73_36280 [Streptosporangiaceae bacterium]|nr:hypothetical protein [Streptosporangiaceae bacterium]
METTYTDDSDAQADRGGHDLPERRADRPGREFLEWHLDEVFLGAAAT